ncbi:interleukin-13 receptor subunit alpha-1 isoform X2 [Leptodactylus fuscus]|uniref:interleukin-13 receptor subunit alpha-1 isoform X2 n=1 Tax=Leptodactylus fuscus TaxID=238119 RepID=UPI003F4EB152
MKPNVPFSALLRLFVLGMVAAPSTASEFNLPSPTNITAEMTSMFCVILKWNNVAANCSVKYNINITFEDSSPKPPIPMEVPKRSWTILPIGGQLDLNNYFSTTIQAVCRNDNNSKSESVKETRMQFTPGDERSPVKNVQCTWYYLEFIDCTWELREEAAHKNIQYKLLYWEKKGDFCPDSAKFHDILRSGTECQNSYPSDGLHVGCTFTYSTLGQTLMFAVTDASYSVKPFLYYTNVNDIAKPRSPVITNVTKGENNTLHIKWDVSPYHRNMVFQVTIDNLEDPFKVQPTDNKESHTQMTITIPNTDHTLRIKVRAQFSKAVANAKYWSDWSEEWIIPGKAKNKTPLLLLILIPAVVVVALVVLLIFLKRMKILIWPSIPHPGKMFQNDLQQWLRSERPATVCPKPEEEQISPLALLKA